MPALHCRAMPAAAQDELEQLTQRVRGDLSPAERGEVELRLGRLYARAGAYDQALLHVGTARRLFEQAGEEAAVGEADATLGAVCGARGEADRARIHIERALAIADELGDRDLKARALNQLAEQAYRDDELERARELW